MWINISFNSVLVIFFFFCNGVVVLLERLLQPLDLGLVGNLLVVKSVCSVCVHSSLGVTSEDYW
jgi:hypothetical protein